MSTLLTLPGENVACVDSQTAEENANVKKRIINEILKERKLLLAAKKARAEDEIAMKEALEKVDGVGEYGASSKEATGTKRAHYEGQPARRGQAVRFRGFPLWYRLICIGILPE